MKKPKIFTIGGAVFDLFVKPSDHALMKFRTPDSSVDWLCMRHGGKIRVEEVIETFGGGACNTAVGFARMGFDVDFVGKVGTMYGDRVLDNLKKEKVGTRFATRTDKDKTSFSTIISSFDGDRTVLGYPGANRFFSVKDLPLKELAKADWIFFNHLTEADSRIPDALIELIKKNPRIKLAWNPGHEQVSQGVKKWKRLLAHTEILFVNKEEAAQFSRTPFQLAGIKRDDPTHLHTIPGFLPAYADDISAIMVEFFKYGVKKVVITDSVNGAQASDGKNLYFCPVLTRKRVDTLGAGDAFASGFSSAAILGKDLKTCLIYGTLNASSVVGSYGAEAGLLTSSQMQARVRQHSLKVSSTKLLK